MAVQDIMTGMQNRRGFTNQAPQMLEEARRKGKFFVLLSADMDFMKKINDQHGHLMGDEAICRMGRAMKKLAEKGLIPVHISGDEFLAYGLKDSEKEAKDMLNAALEAVRKLNEEEPWIEKTSASFGLYTAIPGEKDGLDEFMTRADQAMYEVKNQKKKNKTAVGEVREP
jgi:diguanylate cyclase (GGDEF)-like protein